MSIQIYNTLSRKKEEFQPIESGKVSFYLCGPTVYDYFHIGNARCWVIFDMIRRYLESTGLDVTYIVNLTDVDDKIIQRANERGTTAEDVAQMYVDAFHEDSDGLGINRATANPRATEFIPGMIELIEQLIERDHAYAVDGDVFFHVPSFENYGRLSGKKVEDLVAGTRVDVDSRKKSPTDFALWKSAKPEEPSWDSPWGAGRPGWHIECSVMSMHYLGKEFDIHAGAEDLVFPHHENEIAQSVCGADAPTARTWMHLRFLNFDKQKMSKSLGNVFTVREVLKKISKEALRYFLLQEHYRKPMELQAETFWQTLNGAQSAVDRLGRTTANLALALERAGYNGKPAEPQGFVAEQSAAIDKSMNDDFNTVAALGHVFELARWVNEHIDEENPPVEDLAAAQAVFQRIDTYMGVIPVAVTGDDDEDFSSLRQLADRLLGEWNDVVIVTDCKDALTQAGAVGEMMEIFLEMRSALRADKQWDKSDAIRDALSALGYVIEDTAGIARWRRE
jgi:cysteinyl-tRNA synthetase